MMPMMMSPLTSCVVDSTRIVWTFEETYPAEDYARVGTASQT